MALGDLASALVPTSAAGGAIIPAVVGGVAAEGLEALVRYFASGSSGNGVADGSALFRSRPAGQYLPSRIQVKGPDGQVYVLINAGRAVRGSREQQVMRSIARHEGFVLRRRGSGGGRRARRRPY